MLVDVVIADWTEQFGICKKHATGVYVRCGFNFNLYIVDTIKQYPEIGEIPDYGVCDSIEQFMERFGAELEASDRSFAVGFTEVVREEQSAGGGWRWHKWGPYIGTHDIQCEYLYDESGIERVFTFQLVEVIGRVQ